MILYTIHDITLNNEKHRLLYMPHSIIRIMKLRSAGRVVRMGRQGMHAEFLCGNLLEKST
jgi:hypothetical protein